MGNTLSVRTSRTSRTRHCRTSPRRAQVCRIPDEILALIMEGLSVADFRTIDVTCWHLRRLTIVAARRRVIEARGDLDDNTVSPARWKFGAALLEPATRAPIFLLSGGFSAEPLDWANVQRHARAGRSAGGSPRRGCLGTTEYTGTRAPSLLAIAHMQQARADHACVSVPTMGLAFAIGGRDGALDLASVSVVDVLAGSLFGEGSEPSAWVDGCVPDLPRPRSALTAVCVGNAAIIAMGGWQRPDPTHAGLADVCALGLAEWTAGEGAWKECAPLPQPRMFLSSVDMTERYRSVFVLGGSIGTLDTFHVGENRWTSQAAASCDRWGAAATALEDGRFIVIGGGMHSPHGAYEDCTRSVEMYDPRGGRWWRAADLPRSVWGAVACTTHEGCSVMGGTDARGRSLRSIFLYDARRNAWRISDELLEVGRWCASSCRF